MNEGAPAAKLILRVVIGAIVLWGLYLVIGAFLLRPARAAVLAGCFLGFLGFWWAMYKMRTRRIVRQAQEEEEKANAELEMQNEEKG